MRLKELEIKRKRLRSSFYYAIQGFISSFKSEANMRIHIFIMTLVIILGLFFKISRLEWFICIILFAIVIAGELMNTAVETVVDMITEEKNPKAKLAKDVSAGSVLVLAIGSAVIGLIIFIPKIIDLF